MEQIEIKLKRIDMRTVVGVSAALVLCFALNLHASNIAKMEIADRPAPHASNEIETLLDRANRGSALAQFRLALRYEQGQGVAKDFATAMSWYEESARNGNKLAKKRLKAL